MSRIWQNVVRANCKYSGLALLLAAVDVFCPSAHAQISPPQNVVFVLTDPAGTCASQFLPLEYNVVDGKLWGCLGGSWALINAGGSGGVTGSGTIGSLSKWTGATALGNAVAGTDYLTPTGLSATSPITYNSGTGVIACPTCAGGVSSVAGTANQVAVGTVGGVATVSIANPFVFPGLATFAASTTSNPSFIIPVGVTTTAHTNGAVENLGGGVFSFDDGTTAHNMMFQDTTLACAQEPGLTGDISIDTLCGSQVLTVGGSAASAVGTATVLANNATPLATANAIVLRDSAADFSAHNITGNEFIGSGSASGRFCLNGSSSGTACFTVGSVAGTPADLTLPTTNGSNGNFLSTNGAGMLAWIAGGTVTSVGLTMPSWLTVGGSPVTGTGTLAVSAASGQTAHKLLGTGSGSSFGPISATSADISDWFTPPDTTVASLPSASTNSGKTQVVSDGTSSTDCTAGGGSTNAWCRSNGTIWQPVGGGGAGSGGGTIFAGSNYTAAAQPASSTNYYGALFRGAPENATSEWATQMVVPRAATVQNLYVGISATQSATGSLVCTVRVNSANTTIVATVPAGGITSGNPYTDLTHTATVNVGDSVDLQCVNSATVPAATISYSFAIN